MRVADSVFRVPDAGLVRFLAFYTVALTAIYSLIRYKTPWCMMSFLQGMILLAAVGAVGLIRSVPYTALKAVVSVALLAGLCHLGWQAQRASFNKKYYADWRNPYVYAHTTNDIYNFAARMEQLAQAHPDGHNLLVKVIARDYWPVPWYLRRFGQVGYWPAVPKDADAPVVISSMTAGEDESAGPGGDLDAALNQRLRGKYHKEFFGLRPGVFLLLYIEKGLWDEFLKTRR